MDESELRAQCLKVEAQAFRACDHLVHLCHLSPVTCHLSPVTCHCHVAEAVAQGEEGVVGVGAAQRGQEVWQVPWGVRWGLGGWPVGGHHWSAFGGQIYGQVHGLLVVKRIIFGIFSCVFSSAPCNIFSVVNYRCFFFLLSRITSRC